MIRLRTDAITKIIKSFSVVVAESLFLDRWFLLWRGEDAILGASNGLTPSDWDSGEQLRQWILGSVLLLYDCCWRKICTVGVKYNASREWRGAAAIEEVWHLGRVLPVTKI